MKKYLIIFVMLCFQCEVIANESVKIVSEAFGNKSHPAILLNAGAGGQLITWPIAFCEKLSNRGYYVIRYDYRDTGLSSAIDYTKTPYTVMDLTNDAVNVLKRYGIQKANFVGFSMGGQLAQFAGAYAPDNTKCLVLIATSSDFRPAFSAFGVAKPDNNLSIPTLEYIKWTSRGVDVNKQTLDEKINDYVISWKLLDGSPSQYDEEFYREQGREGYTRSTLHRPFDNHAKAMCASFAQHEMAIDKIKHPTLIIHGEKDPVFPPDHGRMLAKRIPQSKLVVWEDFAHAISPRNIDRLVDTIDEFIKSQPT